MVMCFNFELNAGYCGDTYLASTPTGTAPGACVKCESGGLLFYPQMIVCRI